MKKLLLAVCFCLLAACSTGFAGGIAYDINGAEYDTSSILYRGPASEINNNLNGGMTNDTLAYIQSILEQTFGLAPGQASGITFTQINNVIQGGSNSFPSPGLNIGQSWNYLILKSNGGNGEWYLFANDFGDQSENFLVTPAQGDTFLFFNGFEYGIFNPNSNNFNQGAVTVFVIDGLSPTPEPGSLLLLGTGIIGFALAAKRKLGKK